jgi:polar amino acid transport system substrate-binding protein
MNRLKSVASLFLAGILFILLFAVTPAFPQVVRVGIGYSIAPYVIKEKDSGIEVDVIREVFKLEGYDVDFVYLPNLRLPLAFEEGSVDCIASNAFYDLRKDSGREAFYSDTTVVFRNYAITLKKRAFDIQRSVDLSDKSVLGFNNAVKYLGSEFAAMVGLNALYSEVDDQSIQVRMLYSGRVDVVVTDKRIFIYWRKKLAESSMSKSIDLHQEIVFAPIFAKAPRHVAFGSTALRDDFNKGLATLKARGAIDAIVAKYVGVEHPD